MVRFEVYSEPPGVLVYDYRFIQSYLVAFAPIPSILPVQRLVRDSLLQMPIRP